ncbi:YsnF/AvaK domain-containing protein [Microvirga sp. P5_D2]
MTSSANPTYSSSSRRLVTAFFDSRGDAEDAIERLADAGVSRDSIRFMPGDERDPSDTAGTSYPAESRGFWDSLGDWLLPDEDRSTYAEGLRRGGYLLSVDASDDRYETVIDILDDEGTIDLDERAESWRSEGWSGSSTADVLSGSTANLATGAAGTTSGAASSADRPSSVASAGTSASANAFDTASRAATGEEEVIPVAEERLRVGKREVGHGRVRIRSYVVETPVEEQVTLREERVAVERRPADRALSDVDQAFQERTIEAEERVEEAVVSKEARVKEELVVRKETEQRTETISDTVRSTEIDVEDERGNRVPGSKTTDRT